MNTVKTDKKDKNQRAWQNQPGRDRLADQTTTTLDTDRDSKSSRPSLVTRRHGEEVQSPTDNLSQARQFDAGQWERMFDTVTNGMRVIDLNGQTLYVNGAFCSMAGVDQNELLGHPCNESLHGEACHSDQCPLKRIAGGEKQLSNRVEKTRGDGQSLTCIVSASPIHDENGSLVGIVEDIRDTTESRRAEEELRRFEAIFYNSADMMALLDRNFGYLAVNDKYSKAFGKSADEFIGRTAAEVFGAIFFETVIQPNAVKCLQGQEVRYQDWFDIPILGSRFMQITYEPYYDSEELISGFVVKGRDITERKVAENAFRDSETKLHEKHARLIEGQLALENKNVALAELVEHGKRSKEDLGVQVRSNVDRVVGPVLGRLENSLGESGREQIAALRLALESITDPFVDRLEQGMMHLTPRELEICNLIRNGYSSKDIAQTMHTSEATVRTQRRTIRRKLKLTKSKVNLATYLSKS